MDGRPSYLFVYQVRLMPVDEEGRVTAMPAKRYVAGLELTLGVLPGVREDAEALRGMRELVGVACYQTALELYGQGMGVNVNLDANIQTVEEGVEPEVMDEGNAVAGLVRGWIEASLRAANEKLGPDAALVDVYEDPSSGSPGSNGSAGPGPGGAGSRGTNGTGQGSTGKATAKALAADGAARGQGIYQPQGAVGSD